MFVYDALLEAFKSCIIVGAVCVCIRCLTRGIQELLYYCRSSMCLYTMPY